MPRGIDESNESIHPCSHLQSEEDVVIVGSHLHEAGLRVVLQLAATYSTNEYLWERGADVSRKRVR